MSTGTPFPTRYAPRGMVCAVDHLASGAGVAMLRDGGSAADAAVAASAVLAVTTQHMCGMGGDLLAVVVPPPPASPAALVAAGRAGSGADPDRLRAEGHRSMPFRGDIRAVTVPGCVDGWVELHSRFGRLPIEQVLGPATRYARDGFPAAPTLPASAAQVADVAWAGPYGAPLRPGQLVRRPGVAAALDAVAAEGRSGFYEGAFGEGLLALGGGEFSADDLRRGGAEWSPAPGIDVAAWGGRIWTAPPPSQGYLTLAGAWMAAGLDLPTDPSHPAWAHLLVEATRQAAYDRVEVLHERADPTELLELGRLGRRRAAIAAERAAETGGAFAGGGTIGLTAVDGDRMGVSLLQSNASGFGAHLVEPTTGIFLHNRGIGFSLEAGHPAEYGPGRRPPHTLSPLAVTGPDGHLSAVLATMGGDSQPQVLLQLLARTAWSAEGPADAVAAGRWALSGPAPAGGAVGGTGFSTWAERGRVTVQLEAHAPAGWDHGLEARGHVVARSKDRFGHGFGHAHLIRVVDDHLEGATDPRPRAGEAAGW